ncbi:uncharacterized protein LOC122255933 [Penaeus japonicus]|uniref:uncharacterized protein LOC122255933 n=1 Tax=Penaeus japonicus TaxID=27405 RepID=UPI001C712B1F|nr:uncharacterized protein LOC122255933 [Penaeus japonicus]
MSVAPFVLTRPAYSLLNTLNFPITTTNPATGVDTLRGFVSIVVPITILLDTLLEETTKGRSFSEDQSGVYQALERRISSNFGVDGRACILRFICELQRRPISEWTVAGQLLTVLFTPRLGGGNSDMELLKEYFTAQRLGLKEEVDCEAMYGTCPVSIFRYFDSLKNATAAQDGSSEKKLYDLHVL